MQNWRFLIRVFSSFVGIIYGTEIWCRPSAKFKELSDPRFILVKTAPFAFPREPRMLDTSVLRFTSVFMSIKTKLPCSLVFFHVLLRSHTIVTYHSPMKLGKSHGCRYIRNQGRKKDNTIIERLLTAYPMIASPTKDASIFFTKAY